MGATGAVLRREETRCSAPGEFGIIFTNFFAICLDFIAHFVKFLLKD